MLLEIASRQIAPCVESAARVERSAFPRSLSLDHFCDVLALSTTPTQADHQKHLSTLPSSFARSDCLHQPEFQPEHQESLTYLIAYPKNQNDVRPHRLQPAMALAWV